MARDDMWPEQTNKHRDDECPVPFCNDCLNNIKGVKRHADTLLAKSAVMTPLDKELDEILDTTFGQKGTSWHDEAKQRLRSLILRERRDELNRHFIPHGNNQLETVFRLPDKRISVWGTTDARAAYEYRLAELKREEYS